MKAPEGDGAAAAARVRSARLVLRRVFGEDEIWSKLRRLLPMGGLLMAQLSPRQRRSACVSAWKKDPLGGVIGVQKGPLC
jgi:hypothetical protein